MFSLGVITIDMVTIITTVVEKYGLFVALVVFVIWDNRQRESRYRDRENTFIAETREREKKYIEREDKYIQVIEGQSKSIEKISGDISEIKEQISSGQLPKTEVR